MSYFLSSDPAMKKAFSELKPAEMNYAKHELNKYIDLLRSKGISDDALSYIAANLSRGPSKGASKPSGDPKPGSIWGD